MARVEHKYLLTGIRRDRRRETRVALNFAATTFATLHVTVALRDDVTVQRHSLNHIAVLRVELATFCRIGKRRLGRNRRRICYHQNQHRLIMWYLDDGQDDTTLANRLSLSPSKRRYYTSAKPYHIVVRSCASRRQPTCQSVIIMIYTLVVPSSRLVVVSTI